MIHTLCASHRRASISTMCRQRLSVLYVLIAAAVVGLPRPALGQQPAARRPNVLLIMADDLSNDLGTYGNRVVKTPNLDRLAARGVRFDRAYNQYPLCNPSRASLLSGLRPDTIRVYDLTTELRKVRPGVVTLPQLFQQNGYLAARVGKIYHYGNPGDIGTSGLDDAPSWNQVVNPRGVDKDEEPLLTNYTPARGLGSALAFYASPAVDEEHTDGKVATETIALLEKNRDRPFFIGAGFYRPHCPFIAPRKYFDLYPLDRIAARPFSPEQMTQVPDAALFTRPANWNLTVDQQRETIRAYYASISFLDAQVGRVLDALDRLRLGEHTVVVFMSDHGYNLGEHGQWMKQLLFEPSARAPVIFAGPGVSKGGASSRTVEFIDFYPTLADLAGLAAPSSIEGRSLRPLLRNPKAEWNRPALTQVQRGTGQNAFMGYSIRNERWRYTEWDDGKKGVELYDETTDPAETRNLTADPKHRTIAENMQKLLRATRSLPAASR
jgi:iduronate 2-sulfatase